MVVKVIELEKYDILIPFICKQCGACCRNFAPQIPARDLPKIAKHLQKPLEKIRRRHSECYSKKSSDKKDDCSFLNKEKCCAIYPLRPDGCRLFPFGEFGVADVDCPGYKEHSKIFDLFFDYNSYAREWDLEEYQKQKRVRTIPQKFQTKVLMKIKEIKPSREILKAFVSLNKL